MKKISFLLIFVFALITSSTKAQRKVENNGTKYGICMTSGGVIFTVAGFLTQPEYMWVPYNKTSTSTIQNNNINDGEWKKKPFLEQGARSMCIVSGITLTITGVITMACGY